LRIPETNVTCHCYRDELMLRVVEPQHNDLVHMSIDHSIVLSSGLVDEVDLPGHPSERQDIQLL